MKKKILIIGTYDTKEDELRYLEHIIIDQGGAAVTMDVSVLKDPIEFTDFSKHDVAAAADSNITKEELADTSAAMDDVTAATTSRTDSLNLELSIFEHLCR